MPGVFLGSLAELETIIAVRIEPRTAFLFPRKSGFTRNRRNPVAAMCRITRLMLGFCQSALKPLTVNYETPDKPDTTVDNRLAALFGSPAEYVVIAR